MQIDLGIFAKPIERQLQENGYRFKKEKAAEKYKVLLLSWNMLRVHGIATDAEVDKMANRLIKKLQNDIEKPNLHSNENSEDW